MARVLTARPWMRRCLGGWPSSARSWCARGRSSRRSCSESSGRRARARSARPSGRHIPRPCLPHISPTSPAPQRKTIWQATGVHRGETEGEMGPSLPRRVVRGRREGHGGGVAHARVVHVRARRVEEAGRRLERPVQVEALDVEHALHRDLRVLAAQQRRSCNPACGAPFDRYVTRDSDSSGCKHVAISAISAAPK